MKTSETMFACRLKDQGFYCDKQERKALYVEFTDDITKARLYKSKEMASRSLNCRSQNAPDLEFFEVIVERHYPDIENKEDLK